MKLSHTEENYLKAIFKLAEQQPRKISTSGIADIVDTSAASVTDMLKRLAEKELVEYKKYRGVKLTSEGLVLATHLVRKHRLWELFLVKTLDFSWDEVHDIAEELEHVNSTELINRLDAFLGHPKYDPHGDPIPNESGKFTLRHQVPLSTCNKEETMMVVGVKHHDKPFLQKLDRLKISLGTNLVLKNHDTFDDTFEIELHGTTKVVSAKIAQNILVKTA